MFLKCSYLFSERVDEQMKLQKTDYPNIFSRDDGKYVVTIDFGYHQVFDEKKGKMVQKQKKTRKVCDTLREAKKLISQNNIIKANNKNKNTKDGLALTFKEAHEKYLQHYAPTWTVSYLCSKKSQGKHMVEYFDKCKIKNITTIDVENYYMHLTDTKGLTINTVKHHQSQLKDEFRFFKKNTWIHENPVTDAKIRQQKANEKFEDKVLCIEELQLLIKQALIEDDKSSIVLVTLAALCGMRKGEILGVKWGDLDYDKNQIHVHNNRVQWPEGGYLEKLPKSAKERYTCFPKIAQDLLEIPKKQQEMLLGRKITADDYVYRTPYCILHKETNPLPSVSKCSVRWRQFFTRCQKRLRNDKMIEIRKIEGIAKSYVITVAERERLLIKHNYKQFEYRRLHALRHSFDSILLDNEVNFLNVAACLGQKVHDSLTTSTYYHPTNYTESVNNFWDSHIYVNVSQYLEV